ncbi:MAG: hypothetical protein WA667_16240 [Candidatus Nitrosopolaris sp.]
MPSLDARIFESFIQVIGILLGFTVVGIFYYLGKIDDQKHDFINSLLTKLSRIKSVASGDDEQAKKIIEALGKGDEVKKFYMGEQIRQVMAQMSKIRRETASLSNTFDAIIKDATKVFEEMTDLIRRDFTNIIISYGLAIGLSFVALFFATSGIGRPALMLSDGKLPFS